jgi:hypothetical protein
MPTLRHPIRVVSALAVAGLTATLMAGCIGPIGDLANRGAEEAVESATGGDVSLGGELPAGFPSEVPLLDGEISFSAGSGGAEGWIVTIDPSVSDALAAATAALESGGFAPEAAFEGVDLGAKIYSDGTYLVLLSGDDQAVMYTVTPVAQ